MKRNAIFSLAINLVLLGFMATFVFGCATNKIDWASRVGSYTYDQAVVEFGPPDKQATLKDGSSVVEWLTRRGYAYRYPAYGYYPGYYYGPFYPAYSEGYAPDVFLRLTFDAESRLTAWKKFYR